MGADQAIATTVVRLARQLLFTRTDAYAHLRNAVAAREVEAATCELWAEVERATGALATRAAHVVRTLVAAELLELATARGEPAVVAQTAAVLAQHADAELDDGELAEALVAAWLDSDEVSEVFAEAAAIIAALREA